MTRPDHRDVGEFLRSRRAKVTPEDVGLTTYGQRRVPGLRREELAQLAGVSLTYYTRMEQGQVGDVSPSVIDSVSRALGLTPDEQEHLYHLLKGNASRGRSQRRVAESCSPSTRRLLELMPHAPAILVDRTTDVLAWNHLGHSLFGGGHPYDAPSNPRRRPNLTRWLFTDPAARTLHRDWNVEAERAVASLRVMAGQIPDDTAMNQLVGELCVTSAPFAELWSQHPVRQCVRGAKRFCHPAVGDLILDFEVLHLPASPGHRLIAYSAAPDSDSAKSLALLGSLSLPAREQVDASMSQIPAGESG